MKHFRSEIRNTPSQSTIKVFLADSSYDKKLKNILESFDGIEHVELRETIGQNRADENITVFLKDGVDILKTKTSIDVALSDYFE